MGNRTPVADCLKPTCQKDLLIFPSEVSNINTVLKIKLNIGVKMAAIKVFYGCNKGTLLVILVF